MITNKMWVYFNDLRFYWYHAGQESFVALFSWILQILALTDGAAAGVVCESLELLPRTNDWSRSLCFIFDCVQW